jgi:hypothetical protein
MRKKLLILAGIACMMATTIEASPMVMEMGVAEQVEPEEIIDMNVDGKTVEVKGASGLLLEVVSITGRQVANYKIDSPAQRVELNVPKGCYILKIGKIVRKVTVR